MPRFDDDALVDVLERAQDLGFIGDRPIPQAIEHSRSVVRALEPVTGTVADLGAGGGLPGFVIACDRPDLRLTMIDRRAKRTDFLERMVRRHGLSDRVEVVADDVETVITACDLGRRTRFDAAVARGFGPPATTLRAMVAVVVPAGRMVVTEPPDGDRWDPDLLAELGVRRCDAPPTVAVFLTSPAR